jgi:beta-1,4-mannosyl-glycoprotein beta-1,4-N-acetylglucosaminyltransferase
MKIIDGFIFYNELDLLSYRLKILNDVVDYFVIVESAHTFVGKEKPLFYRDNRDQAQFAEYRHKIIHIIVDDMPYIHPNINIAVGQQWKNEEWQRNAISTGFAKIKDLDPTDILIITDLDEIPDPRSLELVKKGELPVDISILHMDLYYYNLHVKYTEKWYWPKILSYKKFVDLNQSCSMIRGITRCAIITNGGWRLSYFGDYEFIKNKTENFSHQEFNRSEFTDISKIEEQVKKGADLYGRRFVSFDNIPIRDNTYLPIDYDRYLTKYYTE